MRRIAMVIVLAGFALIGAVSAQEKSESLSRKEIDKRVAELIYETTKAGVEQYNSGNIERCLGTYQGALTVMHALLDHRPQTAASIKTALATSKNQKAAEAAHTLRKALDDAQYDVLDKKKPLWERLGGQKAVEAVVHDFVEASAADPKVNFFRDGKVKLDAEGVKKLEKHLVDMIGQETGGPNKYLGKGMKEVHKGMKITEGEFNAIAGHLIETLKKYKVAQTEIDELVKIVGSTKGDIVESK